MNPVEEYAQGTELPHPTWEALKLDIAHKKTMVAAYNEPSKYVDEIQEIFQNMSNDLVDLCHNPSKQHMQLIDSDRTPIGPENLTDCAEL